MAQLTMGQGSVNAGGGVQYPFSSQEIERQRVQEWEGRMVARMIEDSVQLRTAMAAAGLQLPTTGGIGAVGPPEVYSQQSVGGIRNILTGQQGPGMSMLGTAIGDFALWRCVCASLFGVTTISCIQHPCSFPCPRMRA